MKVRLAVATAFALLLMCAAEILACGDKFLIVGRGAAFQRAYVSIHPSSLLVLDKNATARKDVQAQLRRAGHRVSLIASPDQLRDALTRSSYAAVLADLSDIPDLERALSEMRAQPLLLPVVDISAKAQKQSLAERYKCVLQSEKGRRNRRFLATLDAALDSKIKAAPLKCEVKL